MNKSANVDVQQCNNLEDFYRNAVLTVLSKISASLAEHGRCSIAVSGGSTPRRLFELLAEERDVVWSDVHIFWVDERCVPPDHRDSNFNMAHEALFSKISIPGANVHRIVTEGFSPSEAAASYEMQLKEFFGGVLPVFDLVLLGMGADGHMASLFPGDEALGEKERWVVAVDGEHGIPIVPRVTLTLPVLNNARCSIFLVAGEDKMPLVDEILSDPEGVAKKYPAAMVHPKGELIWIISG